MINVRCLLLLTAPLLLSTACQHSETARPTSPSSAVAAESVLPPGVYISPVRQGDSSVPFAQEREFKQTFPNNQIGANLAFTSNLRMPRLEAVEMSEGRYQLHMRFSNATDAPLFVSLTCIYEGETRADRVIRAVEFPVNTFRDIVMDMSGEPGRKLNIYANAVTTP